MATTTKTMDFMGRSLTNPDPGTSDATDHLGRDVVTGDKDFVSRDLEGEATEPDPEPDPG